MVDLLTNDGEFDGLTIGAVLQDVVAANWHRRDLSLKSGRNFRHFDILADRLVRLHVETLDSISAIDFGQKLRMECDDDLKMCQH